MSLAGAILGTLAHGGTTAPSPADLHPFDQLHPMGAAATRGLARLAGLAAGERVADLGCGIGGPARLLAAEFGAEVAGVDLSASYVAAATALTEAVGMGGNPRFLRGDALAPPLGAGTFDVAWVQQSAMAIADKAALYRSAARLVRAKGRLALADCLAGPEAGLHLPVPWARRAEASHLVDADALRAALARAGFVEQAWRDATADGLDWYRRLERRAGGSGPGAALVLGPDVPDMVRNLRRNLEEGRVLLIEAVFTLAADH